MMPKTGNSGFTLIEVMAATAILSVATLFIYEAFFSALDGVDYYRDYFTFAPYLEEKLWEAEDTIASSGGLSGMQTSGTIEHTIKRYDWRISVEPLDQADGAMLYRLAAIGSWKVGRRAVSVTKAGYILYRERPKG